MRASKKVEGGKSVEVIVGEKGDVGVLGDFFMHPEDAIDGLEDVVEENVDSGVEELTEAIDDYLDSNNVELLGVEARDVAETAVEARKR